MYRWWREHYLFGHENQELRDRAKIKRLVFGKILMTSHGLVGVIFCRGRATAKHETTICNLILEEDTAKLELQLELYFSYCNDCPICNRRPEMNPSKYLASLRRKGRARSAWVYAMRHRYGATYQQIGAACGISRERARQIVAAVERRKMWKEVRDEVEATALTAPATWHEPVTITKASQRDPVVSPRPRLGQLRKRP